MENNKILLGIQFNDVVAGNWVHNVVDLYVLRDITIDQLFDGIFYGLERSIALSSGQEREQFENCLKIYRSCTGNQAIDKNVYKQITLNRFDAEKAKSYMQGDRVLLKKDHMGTPICDMGFITSTQLVFFSSASARKAAGLDVSNVIQAFNPASAAKIRFPEYNISTREIYQFDRTPCSIIPPSNPPEMGEENMLGTLLPGMLSMIIMMFARSVGSGFDLAMIAMSAMMLVGSVLSALFLNRNKRKEHERKLETWRKNYESYINKTINAIRNRQARDCQKLHELYPDVDELALDPAKGIFTYNDQIFSRSAGDEDFLTVRLGVSDNVESIFPIEGEAKQEVSHLASYTEDVQFGGFAVKLHAMAPEKTNTFRSVSDFTFGRPSRALSLNDLPADIKRRYQYLSGAPLLYSFKNCGALGIVDPNLDILSRSSQQYALSNAEYMIRRMIFELCYYHAPEDLQFVIFFNECKNSRIKEQIAHSYKYLPHFRGLFDDKSQFVFDKESASLVMGSLINQMAERGSQENKEGESKTPKGPHIIFIVFEEYGMKEHAFAQYLPVAPDADTEYVNNLGLSFVFATKYKEYLPAYCNDVIRVNANKFTLTPRDDKEKVKTFRCPKIDSEYFIGEDAVKITTSYEKAFDFFSGIFYARITQNGKVPSAVTMFELMNTSEDKLESQIVQNWDLPGEGKKRKFDATKSLGVAIGKTEIGIATLDLHERADGPHMLVAGTTGSGKSETIISLLLGLCMNFRPSELNLLLVDMKGGGFTQRLGKLPHVVGTITDVDGDENGTGAEYMLSRFLDAMTSEIKRRKRLLNKMRVDNIDDYIKACRDIDSHIRAKEIPENEREELKLLAKESLPHLILVVDEFTELKRFSSENSDIDFISEITTIARVGRSLGYHICLISQNIQGAITEDISVNSKSRLCLKVATRQASKEMIGTDLAASPTMPGMGRAYLLVGTGSKFEYFQSAYSGAHSLAGASSTPFQITLAPVSGAYRKFYDSKEDNREMNERIKKIRENGNLKTQLEAITASILNVHAKYRDDLPQVHQVFQPPLQAKIAMDSNGLVLDEKGMPVYYTKERGPV